MRTDLLGDPGAASHPADDPGGAVPVEPLAVGGEEQRSFGALAGGQVDRPGGAGRERYRDDLAALAGDDQGPTRGDELATAKLEAPLGETLTAALAALS